MRSPADEGRPKAARKSASSRQRLGFVLRVISCRMALSSSGDDSVARQAVALPAAFDASVGDKPQALAATSIGTSTRVGRRSSHDASMPA